MGGYAKRRLADVFLVVAWVVVVFQIAQISQIQNDSTTRKVVSALVMIGIGVVVTVLWRRSRVAQVASRTSSSTSRRR